MTCDDTKAAKGCKSPRIGRNLRLVSGIGRNLLPTYIVTPTSRMLSYSWDGCEVTLPRLAGVSDLVRRGGIGGLDGGLLDCEVARPNQAANPADVWRLDVSTTPRRLTTIITHHITKH